MKVHGLNTKLLIVTLPIVPILELGFAYSPLVLRYLVKMWNPSNDRMGHYRWGGRNLMDARNPLIIAQSVGQGARLDTVEYNGRAACQTFGMAP